MKKQYDLWFPQKKQLDQNKKVLAFSERDVRWCRIGINIGYEIFGKGKAFTRPVLILKKHSRFTFIGAPLSTREPNHEWHYPIEIKGSKKPSIIRLDQIRTYDARRLQKRIYSVPENIFDDIKNRLKSLL